MKQIILFFKSLFGIKNIKWVKFKQDEFGRTHVVVYMDDESTEEYITTDGIYYYSKKDLNRRTNDRTEQILYRYYINYYYFENERD